MSTAPRLTHVVLDAADVPGLSRFWADLLGGTVEVEDDGWHTIHLDGSPALAVQHSPGHQPPSWPDGAPQQVHLDFAVDDIAQAHAHAVSVGAQVLEPPNGPDPAAPQGFQVYADPAGHPFCLCWG